MAVNDGEHLDEGTLAGFLDGDLSANDRERVAAHLEECEECRTELRQVGELAASFESRLEARRRSPRIRRWGLLGGALAASLIGFALLRRTAGPEMPASSVRDRAVTEGAARIDVVAPASRDVARSDTNFVWRPANVDVYRFTLMNESGAVLFRAEVADTSIVWPRTVPVTPGTSYFWRVDGVAEGVTSSTGARRLRILP